MASNPKPGKDRALTKAERRARSLANLRPAKKGEIRNPTGKNGRERSDYVVDFLCELDGGQPRIRHVLLAQYRRAKRGSDSAGKFLGEQWGGRARQQLDLVSSDRSMSPTRKPTTAETRQELDRVVAVVEKVGAAGIHEGSEAPASEPKAAP